MARSKMSSKSSENAWANQYLLDPLTAPEPSQEDGPGSTFVNPDPLLRTFSRRNKDSTASKNETPLPTPPTSASPTRVSFQPPSNTSVSRSTSTRNHTGSRSHPPRPEKHTRSISTPVTGFHRPQSISQRYPGDMSHRPLDVIKREQRAADRSPHLRTRRHGPNTDIIDGLDTMGGIYHHGGPYDATLASRNRNKMYSPLDAVKDSNMEALRATPREYVIDSLERHVPLQGTATIPAGYTDLSGKVMNYEEGADLMREADAAGGAYKRWDGIKYHPDDLKGKGEPSYTYEKDLKEKKRLRHSMNAGPAEYEMRSGMNREHRKNGPGMVRQRSVSNAADGRPGPAGTLRPSNSPPAVGFSKSTDIGRSNSAGKRFSEGFKRRFGSLRKKTQTEA
ncbi:hypothetical protein D7B24_002655 [Verticillium nonalfalfae]|uniref:Pal1 cell morphology n=1 Tax=Verticillium nonalfalfae TaxID=1051616 RepID=A0A3M9XY17_9PEZI|nr:uncharacterized protein D7B24_002655 [Verticillium nonalfalfae]RNJ52921.1 hypothetical protein D7B24_002655 [Verticillium nonalfalfae]